MYTLSIIKAMKKMSANDIKNLSLKTIINELDFLKKTVIVDWKKKKSANAFKDHSSSFKVEILNYFNPELQLKSRLIELLAPLKGFKLVTTLVLVFKNVESKDKRKYWNFYSSSKAEIIINKNDIYNVFQPIFATIMENIRKWLGNGSN